MGAHMTEALMTGAQGVIMTGTQIHHERFGSMTGSQICETPEFQAAIKAAKKAVRLCTTLSLAYEMEDILETLG
jgi:hypothetical protein